MTQTSSSELLKISVLKDRTATLSVGGRPEKRVGVMDAIGWLRGAIPELSSAIRVDEDLSGQKEIKMGRYLVSMRDRNEDGSVKKVFLYRPEGRGRFSLEMNSSGGSALDVYTHLFQDIVRHYGISKLNEMLSTIGATFDNSKRILTVSNLLYPSLVCEYDITRLPEPDENGRRVYGVQGAAYYGATSATLPTIWAVASDYRSVPNRFLIPFSNFFSEGTMCFGTIDRVDKFVDNGNFRQFDYYLDVLMTSNYNFDLCHMSHTGTFSHHMRSTEGNYLKKFLMKFDNFDETVVPTFRVTNERMSYLNFVFMLADPSLSSFPYHLFGV